MVRIENLAEAALRHDGLLLRSLAQDLLRAEPDLGKVPDPQTGDARVRMASAALIELLAERTGQAAPSWAKSIGKLPEPFFLLASAASMKRLRLLCEQQSPEPLRRHGFFAPPNFLEFV